MKIKNIFSLIINFIVLAIAAIGVTFATIGYNNPIAILRFFTLLSNSFVALVSLWGILRSILALKTNNDKPCFVYKFFRFAATVSLILTFVVSVAILETANDAWYEILLHIVIPSVALVEFLFIESDHKNNFLVTLGGISLVIIYAAYILPMCNVGNWEAPYAFINLKGDDMLQNLLLMALMLLGSYIVSIVLYFINYGLNALLYKNADKHLSEIVDDIPEVDSPVEENNEEVIETVEEPKEEEKVEEVKETKTKTTKKVAKKKVEETPVKEPTVEEEKTKPEYRIYHVSKRASDDKWQVKFAKGSKAIKLFRTQAEAIEYAKKLAESQNGSIRVHSVKGKIRKA